MTHYVAKFSSGFVAEIKKSERTYTHAWYAWGTYTKSAGTWTLKGFAKSEAGAYSNMAKEIGKLPKVGSEVVAMEIVT